MRPKPNDNGPVLSLAQLARFACHVIAGLRGANNNNPPRRGLRFFGRINWDNANDRANPHVGQLVGMSNVIARQIDRKTLIVCFIDPMQIFRVVGFVGVRKPPFSNVGRDNRAQLHGVDFFPGPG
jgi:hypothetical protein